MGTGKLHDDELTRIAAEIKNVPGDLAEIGVYQGHLFLRLAKLAESQGRVAHALDSFAGMDTPGLEDGDQYPRGALFCGLAAFEKVLVQAGVLPSSYRLWKGYIPACFEALEDTEDEFTRFAFAWVDVDHLGPTEQALAWVWPRIAPGGIMGCDDYFPGRAKLASPAIDRFTLWAGPSFAGMRVNENNQVFISKAENSVASAETST